MKSFVIHIRSYTQTDWNIIFNEILIGLFLITLVLHNISFFKGNVVDEFLVIISVVGVFPVIWSACVALWKRKITIDLLASIALIFTFVEGQWVSAVFINLMLSSARLFDAFTDRRTQNIIAHLLKLRPEIVHVKRGDTMTDIAVEEVRVGDLVVIEAGERISVDGVVINGQAGIDESTLTGESEPVAKKVGSRVFSSTLNCNGSLVIRAEKVGINTTLAKMISLVTEASREKTKIERMADRFSFWYIILILISSGIIYFFSHNLSLVLSVLLVVCADDIAVAVPLGFTISIAKGARHGLVIKGAAVLETLRKIQVIVTDKTGTLTKGMAKVNNIIRFGIISNELFYQAAGCAVVDSEHPTSRAISRYLKEKGIIFHAPDTVHESPGEGVIAEKDSHFFIQGKLSFLEKNKVVITDVERKQIDTAEMNGGSISAVAVDGVLAGVFVLEDEIRPYAKEVVAETKELGVKKWIMLTGDNTRVASRVATAIGIDEFRSELTPEGKIQALREIQKQYGSLAMMGDGVNDAAALAMADVSFAMGAIGSDVSIEAADIAIMHDDLRRVPEAMFLGIESIRIVKQNFLIWVLTNVVGLVLVFGGYIGPVGAAVYNFATDFIPIMNVFKIYWLKINKHTYDTFR